jgi:hypothetical protein
VNDTLSARNVEYEQEAFIPASGSWTFTPRPVPQAAAIIGQGALKTASVALWLAVSPLTAIADPWLGERQRRASASAAIALDSVRRRRITLAEALELADEIMRRAEEGRIRAAEAEARRLFDLESFS